MRVRSLVSVVACLVVGGSVLGCSSAPDEEEGETSDGELRVLGSDEVVGTIDYGTSLMEVENPGDRSASGGRKVYRAVRFQGAAGDEIVARAIGANAADPVLYLLGDRFGTVKSNDDRAPGAKDSEITHKLSRSGTYYLAFRTKEGWRTKFYVSLEKKGGGSTNPPPPPPPVSWRSAFDGFARWGIEFSAVIPSGSYYSPHRKHVLCKLTPANSTIACGTMMDATTVVATIQDDGTFSSSTGTTRSSGGELSGRIGSDGKATLTRFRRTECFQTSSYWCEGQETDGQNLPAQATPYRLCRTPDQTFGQGGWASGFYVDCAKCADYGGCEP